ncbi:MAG: hypothetical protein R3F20_11740 [Planctomycetota bacterium]
MRRLAALVALLALAAAPGCLLVDITPGEQNVVPYRSERPPASPLRRVVLPPLRMEDAESPQELALRNALVDQITSRGLFEVVPVTARDLEDIELDSARMKGVYSTADLLALNRRFGADGVFTGTLLRFRAYPQMQIGMRLHLIDCRSGRVLWGTDLHLDASDRRVADDAHNWYDLVYRDPTESLVEHEKVLVSPRLFSTYAAYRISATLARSLRPESRAAEDPRPAAAVETKGDKNS